MRGAVPSMGTADCADRRPTVDNKDGSIHELAWNAFATLAAVMGAVATQKLADVL